MGISENPRQSLIPSFLYSPSSPSKTLDLRMILSRGTRSVLPPPDADLKPTPAAARSSSFLIPSPSEPGKIEMYSPAFYAACTAGGIASCGLTHMSVTSSSATCRFQAVFG
ncbi:hypothetical protein QJS10_CPB04g00132 [Acorus calamus]|uniref:Uncharacterized protein n=1 Tax=Acorus calamus TaxID=4465 RepID=A0AAV9EZX7_ACOCL|nr:hypothetical protein QJS10_CPB04g00132 [Acorus calamus]